MKLLKTLTVVLAIISGQSNAQVSETPKIEAALREIGNKFDWDSIKQTIGLYQALHQTGNTDGLTLAPDQPYGPHKLHVLDVFAPDDAEDAPVLVFTHGGGFVAGDKANARNIGLWAARHGMVGVTTNYRLAPEIMWPEGAKDLAMALDWVKNNIKSYGGNPSQIIVAGESAGSIHTADYIFREELQNPDDGVIGALLISTPTTDLEASSSQMDPQRDLNYYGHDGDRHAQSVVNAVEGRKIPVMIAFSEYEPDFILDQTLLLIEALARRDGSETGRRMPLISSAAGHNHISISAHIGTADETLGPDILEFIDTLMD